VDSIFGDIDFALIEYTSLSGRGILYLVEVANDATEHMRKDFAAVWGGVHFIPVSYLGDLDSARHRKKLVTSYLVVHKGQPKGAG
jgi:hypothetical protein